MKPINNFDNVQAAGGFLTAQDLENYEVETLEPVRGSYRGYTVLSSPLPSSGGTHVIEALNILENFDISSYGFGSAEDLHIKAETFKWIFKDRAVYMGDPNYVAVPQAGLISPDYAAAVAAQFDPEKDGNVTDTVRRADQMMYTHKKASKNTGTGRKSR